MKNLNELGRVYTTDVLILGGGNAGLAAAHTAKNAGLDVLVVDRSKFGYTGQSTRAGHGLCFMKPEDKAENVMYYAVVMNKDGLWLNDQEVLMTSIQDQYTYLQELETYGAQFSHEEDGSIHGHKEFPQKPASSTNVDLDLNTGITECAMKRGIRFLDRVYFTDLLKDGDRVIGAVGFDMENLETVILQGKAVINAGNAFNFCPGGMFMMGADAQIAAYRAGAQFRNAEQATYIDLNYRNTKEYIYGMHMFLVNALGENISQKYAPNELEEVSIELVEGMIEEVKAGRGPIYLDYSQIPPGLKDGFYQGQLMPKRLGVYGWLHYKNGAPSPKPEVSVDLKVLSQSLRVDKDIKTSLEGLWGPGSISMYGSAYGGWMHGDGVGWGLRSGLRAGRGAAEYALTHEHGTIDPAQVEAAMARVYAPMQRKDGILPSELMDEFGMLILQPKYTIEKTEQSMNECLAELDKLLDKFERKVYVPEGNAHYLGKANEVYSDILMMKIILAACKARKETRGAAIRADYPERDDKNWLKWVIVEQGVNGEPEAHYERIPFERYPMKPEGWTDNTVPAE